MRVCVEAEFFQRKRLGAQGTSGLFFLHGVIGVTAALEFVELLALVQIQDDTLKLERWQSTVYCDCPENSCSGNRTGGSNPSLSAKLKWKLASYIEMRE